MQSPRATSQYLLKRPDAFILFSLYLCKRSDASKY